MQNVSLYNHWNDLLHTSHCLIYISRLSWVCFAKLFTYSTFLQSLGLLSFTLKFSLVLCWGAHVVHVLLLWRIAEKSQGILCKVKGNGEGFKKKIASKISVPLLGSLTKIHTTLVKSFKKKQTANLARFPHWFARNH